MLATLLVGPVARAGTIVPGESIDGVRIGQGTAAVKRILGAPPETHKVGLAVLYRYPAHNDLNVYFKGGKVITVYVTALPGHKVLDHTAEGIGLGSRMSAAEQAYPDHCDKPYPDTPPVCSWETSWATGGAVMYFKSSGRFGVGWKAPVESIELIGGSASQL